MDIWSQIIIIARIVVVDSVTNNLLLIVKVIIDTANVKPKRVLVNVELANIADNINSSQR